MKTSRYRRQSVLAVTALMILASVGGMFFLIFLTGMAYPHPAPPTVAMPQGWQYPPGCCNSAKTSPNGDCDAIPRAAVKERPDGYHVVLKKGEHPRLITKGYSVIIPYANAKPSPDGNFHLCVGNDGWKLYCFFAPSAGT